MNEEAPLVGEFDKRWKAAQERQASQSAKQGGDFLFQSSKNLNHAHDNPQNTMNKIQGYILIALGCLIFGLLSWSLLKSPSKYQYKVVSVQAQFAKGVGADSDQGTTSVGLKDEELTLLGRDGWELVDSILEMETTHPNYGSSQYVTGLQPNIRPQRAVLIFRKAL